VEHEDSAQANRLLREIESNQIKGSKTPKLKKTVDIEESIKHQVSTSQDPSLSPSTCPGICGKNTIGDPRLNVGGVSLSFGYDKLPRDLTLTRYGQTRQKPLKFETIQMSRPRRKSPDLSEAHWPS